MISFKIRSIEEIEIEILKAKGNVQNFPKIIDFPFPEHYKKLVSVIKTTEIASEAILYNAVEAVNENKEYALSDSWCFAGNGQGDRWFLDRSGTVFFYNHDDEKSEPMNISFEEWLQMAFIVQQLDFYLDEHDEVSEPVRQNFYDTLNAIHPQLGENYPFIV
ncbi:SMI1/KNR4 family protein [Chryseobacterium sp. Marseille-Q3244]|uniref:SMI1/KNR4 family protein n=1 Tax=Chryseobacterium sp. Marseille-Q3244 TaxID=2758092 RepID=UPI002024000C|nr:SMI1/KNR4 family protein [Chryseobacterium sp. Marseille-Q3244]